MQHSQTFTVVCRGSNESSRIFLVPWWCCLSRRVQRRRNLLRGWTILWCWRDNNEKTSDSYSTTSENDNSQTWPSYETPSDYSKNYSSRTASGGSYSWHNFASNNTQTGSISSTTWKIIFYHFVISWKLSIIDWNKYFKTENKSYFSLVVILFESSITLSKYFFF